MSGLARVSVRDPAGSTYKVKYTTPNFDRKERTPVVGVGVLGRRGFVWENEKESRSDKDLQEGASIG